MGKLKGGAGGGASRKELRKAHRQAAKEKKQQRHLLKQVRSGAWCVVPELLAGFYVLCVSAFTAVVH